MLCLLTRFFFLICTLTVCSVACADPPEVRLTPRDEYAKIPTRREMEHARALSANASNGTDTGQSQSILERVELDEQLTEQATAAPKLSQQSRSLTEIRQAPTLSSAPVAQSQRQDTNSLSAVEAFGTFGHYPGPSELDLMEFLPVPNRQKKQNCVAWALGYANYSCQICQERRISKPVDDHQLFSPSFIYNKLNHDPEHGTVRDDGLIVTEAIQFILEHGCATAKTMPLFESNLPSSAAENEANIYRAFGHQKAENVGDIRAYIQEGYPVILVVRNSPEFKKNERLDKPYIWERTDKEMENLEPHAVCAVGYNDDKEAVLVMNSYGDRWKDKGFCWVDYETLSVIPAERSDDLEVWCLEAHVVMIKNNNPIVSMSYKRPGGGGFGSRFHSSRTINVSFILKDDGMVYAGGTRVSPNVLDLPKWHLEDLTCNDETIFVLREDQMVARLNNDDDVVKSRQHSAIWAHLKNGVPSGSRIRMIAAAKKSPLFALTNKGELLQLPAGGSRWQTTRVDAAGNSELIDLRDDQSKGTVSLSTNDGRVFTFEDEGRWVVKTN